MPSDAHHLGLDGLKHIAREDQVLTRERGPLATAIEALLSVAGELDREAKDHPQIEKQLVPRRAIVATLLLAGPRIGELVEVRWDDVDLANGRIQFDSKTPAGCRWVRLLPALRHELATLKAVRDPTGRAHVFGTARGGKQSESNIRNRVLTRPRFIINFPTKDHWRSRLGDIDAGLADLRAVIVDLAVESVALPPLGCGLGGLRWSDVRPRTEAALSDLPVRTLVFEPHGAPAPEAMIERRERPRMTPARATLIWLLGRYLAPGDRRALFTELDHQLVGEREVDTVDQRWPELVHHHREPGLTFGPLAWMMIGPGIAPLLTAAAGLAIGWRDATLTEPSTVLRGSPAGVS